MGEWQPIETAPKDGVKIILASITRDWTAIGAFVAPESFGYLVVGDDDGPYFGDDEAPRWMTNRTTICSPTHWMPLPEPPKGNAAQKSGESKDAATHLGHEDQSNITEKVSQP